MCSNPDQLSQQLQCITGQGGCFCFWRYSQQPHNHSFLFQSEGGAMCSDKYSDWAVFTSSILLFAKYACLPVSVSVCVIFISPLPSSVQPLPDCQCCCFYGSLAESSSRCLKTRPPRLTLSHSSLSPAQSLPFLILFMSSLSFSCLRPQCFVLLSHLSLFCLGFFFVINFCTSLRNYLKRHKQSKKERKLKLVG